MTERGPEQPQGWSPPSWDKPAAADAPPAVPPTPPGWGAPPAYGSAPAGWGGPPRQAPRPGVVPLRPLGLGELLDGAVSVVRGYPRQTLGPSLVVALISTVLGVTLLALLPEGVFSSDASAEVTDAQLGGAAVGALGTAVLGALVGIVLAGIITAVVGKAVLGQPLTTGDAWRAVRPLLARLIGLALLVGLVVVGVVVAAALLAALAFAVAGDAGLVVGVPVVLASLGAAVYLYVRLALAAPVLVLEKTGIVEALRRSGVLVRSSFWRVLGVLLLTAIIAAVVSNVLQLPFLALGGGAGFLTGSGDEVGLGTLVLTQVGAGVGQTLTAPFTSGVLALLYIDRRMRAEGLDVALAAAAAAPRS